MSKSPDESESERQTSPKSPENPLSKSPDEPYKES